MCDAEVPSTYAVKTKCRNEAAVILGFHHVKFDSVLLVQFFIIRARMYYLHVILGFHHIQFLLVQFFFVRAGMYYLHVYYMC